MKKIFSLILISLIFNINLFSSDIYVTNTNDSGLGSLREAIVTANGAYGGDNIVFDIPVSDGGFNAVTGVWTITLLTPLPYIYGATTIIDGNTQTQNHGDNNLNGPEILIKCDSMLEFAFAIVSTACQIKNLIINGFRYGIVLYNNTCTNNIISGCYFSTNHTGALLGIPNENGISVASNASNNTIINNLISGCTNAGIAALDAGGCIIKANKIGTDISGTLSIPNMYGIAMENSSNNIIGGSGSADRNIISGNSFTGIGFNGLSSTNNTITANFIGTDVTGTQLIPNEHGIVLSYASNNTIGGNEVSKRNIISGNTSAGIVLNGTGTKNNVIKGNYIGTDTSGLMALSNYAGVILKSKSNCNTIGGNTANERNIISANIEMGIYVEASDSNIITGNYIGPDVTGLSAFKTGDTLLQANGIEFNTVSKYNRLGGYTAGERNIISGNRVYGMVYYGNVSYNQVVGNYIGVDVTGNNPLANATGICVDGGSNNNPIINNVLSGNISYGIFIVTTGSNYNEFKGNIVGLNASGTDTVPNESGLLIGGGTKYNTIGGTLAADRNIFSGNRFAGIQIADIGTKFNTIKGNYIGTDINGSQSLANYYGLCLISNASENIIDSNIISGNSAFGILFENADSNYIYRNKIGMAANPSVPLGNGAAGMVIYAGAAHNKIGAPDMGNIIAHHDTTGILIMDNNTVCNTISGNSIYSNNYLGIDIFPPGNNTNDIGDTDTGPNHLMNSPVIMSATFNPVNNYAWISGQLDTEIPESCIVELFIAESNFLNYGDGKTYIGNTNPDCCGLWTYFGPGVTAGEVITATATNACGSTSEFCQNFTVVLNNSNINEEFKMLNIFPNPAQDFIYIETTALIESLNICDALGREILCTHKINKGKFDISSLKSGIYFIKVKCDDEILIKKFIKQ